MQLAERGQLKLDEPASDIIPCLSGAGVLEGFGDDGQPIIRPARRAITLRHLLTHTAGFGYELFNQEIVDFQSATGSPSVLTRKLGALKMPLLFDPGERWIYAINIDWAGQMVEAVSGQSLGEYLRQNIFEPLEMNSSGYSPNGDMTARQAGMHLRSSDGELLIPENAEPPPEREFYTGGMALFSTMQDYARFHGVFLNQGSHDGWQILLPDTMAMMSADQMGENRVTPLKSVMPPYTNDVEFFPGIEKVWGLSFMFNLSQAATGRSTGSLSWAGSSNLYYWIDLARNIVGVYGTQIFPFSDKLSLPLYLDLETAVYETL